MQYEYTWLVWSLILIGIWGVIYFLLNAKDKKREMLVVSLWTSVLGLTEPLFVPEYWSPPSLFNLALRTGFDIESIIFSFGVGGIAVIIYELVFKTKHEKINYHEQHLPQHRNHLIALFSAPFIFFLLFAATSINPIYISIISMTGGGLFSWYCRPDLKKKMITSAIIFLGIYFVYFFALIVMYPGYVEEVWNLKAISGILIFGIPLEELLFALSFGFIWSGVYEHLTWHKIKTV